MSQMAAPPPRAPFAVLFDWDGVVIDSRALHQSAWDEVARELGHPHGPEEFRRHFGAQNRRAIMEVLGWTQDEAEMRQIAERKEVLFRERLEQSGDLVIPGVSAFLAELSAAGVPRAVVSSSPRLNIERMLERAERFGSRGIRRAFPAIVAAEDTSRGKPDPACYELGAERLGVPASRCVVLEDAPVGIEAGLAAGMRVVALTTTHPASELGRAHLVIDGYGPGLLERISGWFA